MVNPALVLADARPDAALRMVHAGTRTSGRERT